MAAMRIKPGLMNLAKLPITYSFLVGVLVLSQSPSLSLFWLISHQKQ